LNDVKFEGGGKGTRDPWQRDESRGGRESDFIDGTNGGRAPRGREIREKANTVKRMATQLDGGFQKDNYTDASQDKEEVAR